MTSPLGPTGGAPTSDEKVMAGLACLGSWILCIPTIIIFILKKDQSNFIKFHCLQTFALFVVGFIIGIAGSVVSMVPVIGWIIGLIVLPIVSIGLLIYWIVITVKAFMGETIRVPMLADIIDQNWMG